MDYEAVAAHFLIPKGTEPPAPVVSSSPARRLRDSIEAIATIGWWSREAAAASTGLGHDFFDGYVWGRAAALGADVAPSVVVSAFGVFNAALLGAVYVQGRSISSREAILEARASGASAGLRNATSAIAPERIASAGDRLLTAVLSVEPGPRHLFGALQSLPVPADAHGRLWRAAELVREHRGDTHLAACAVAGLDMAEMSVLTEVWLGYPVGEYSATRGYSPEGVQAAAERLAARGWMSGGVLTEAGRIARDGIEAATDRGQQQVVDAIDDLDELISALTAISNGVLSSHAAPADPRKRAAG